MDKTETIKIRLSEEQTTNLKKVARLAGVKEETVVNVMLALYAIKRPTPPEGGGNDAV